MPRFPLCALCVFAVAACSPTPFEQTRQFSASRPLYEQPLDLTPPSATPLSAESCASCHTAIYKEWQVSTHALAWKDPQFQAEIKKSDNRWLCMNCHTPLLNQQEYWPVGLKEEDVEKPILVKNPVFDAALREEGITCTACHLVEGQLHGPGFSNSTAPHPVVPDERFKNNALCTRCHQAVAAYPGKNFICTFNTGLEWEASPYAPATGCPDCHMPAIKRPAAEGGMERTVGQHWWRGAGIPKFTGIDTPKEANHTGLELQASLEGALLTITATNQYAGHLLPTGDPERWIQIDAWFVDGAGNPLGERWSLKIGQQWEWYPEVKKLGDTRLNPKESRSWFVAVPAGAVSATIEASSNRLTEETALYHGLLDYPRTLPTHHLTVKAADR